MSSYIKCLIVSTAIFVSFASVHAAELHTVAAILQPAKSRQSAPPWRLADVAGRSVRLSDYRGDVVLLDFWATECGGCKLEIPWFIQIASASDNGALKVIGVSEDILYEDLKSPAEAWARVTPFVRSHNVNYTIVMGDGVVSKGYNITALPATYLIDRNGGIAATYIGLVNRENLRTNITKLLAEPFVAHGR